MLFSDASLSLLQHRFSDDPGNSCNNLWSTETLLPTTIGDSAWTGWGWQQRFFGGRIKAIEPPHRRALRTTSTFRKLGPFARGSMRGDVTHHGASLLDRHAAQSE